MINLIPNQEKKKMIKSFYFRLGILCLWMLCIPLLLASLLLLPAYFFSSYKNNIAAKKLEIQKAELTPILNEENSKMVKDVKKKLNIIENSQKNQFSVSEKVINAILVKKVPSIKITQIFYENDAVKGKRISISGTASSRETLLSFRRALEESKSFTSVDLPVSNFIRGSNIQFSLSLIPA